MKARVMLCGRDTSVDALRLVAERMVGRRLGQKEWVRSISGNPMDCRRENIQITNAVDVAWSKGDFYPDHRHRYVRGVNPYMDGWKGKVHYAGTAYERWFEEYDDAVEFVENMRETLGLPPLDRGEAEGGTR